MKKDPKTFRMVPDWWASSKKMLSNFDIQRLVNFDNEKEMNESKFKKLDNLFKDPESKEYLSETAIKYSSLVAAGMFLWVVGQKNLYVVNKTLRPKRLALKGANAELEKVSKILHGKQTQLN